MCGEPLALTSANISSQTSTVAVHVSEKRDTAAAAAASHRFHLFSQYFTLGGKGIFVSLELNLNEINVVRRHRSEHFCQYQLIFTGVEISVL